MLDAHLREDSNAKVACGEYCDGWRGRKEERVQRSYLNLTSGVNLILIAATRRIANCSKELTLALYTSSLDRIECIPENVK